MGAYGWLEGYSRGVAGCRMGLLECWLEGGEDGNVTILDRQALTVAKNAAIIADFLHFDRLETVANLRGR